MSEYLIQWRIYGGGPFGDGPPFELAKKKFCRTSSSKKSKETGFGESGGHGLRQQSAST